jgi:hypothetical protein
VPVPSHGDTALDAPEVSLTGSDEAARSSTPGASEADAEGGAAVTPQRVSASGSLWASFRILSTEQVSGSNGTSDFTRYRLCTTTADGHSWIVYKRYSDFQNLRQRLVDSRVPGIEGVPFPKKKLRRKNSVREETIEVRSEALQRWYACVVRDSACLTNVLIFGPGSFSTVLQAGRAADSAGRP